MYTFHTYRILLKTFPFALHANPLVSTGFAEQIMPILRILCYNGSLVTWTVVSLTTAKFKPLYYWTVSELYYDRHGQSSSLSVLVSSTHLGLTTKFLLLPDYCPIFQIVKITPWQGLRRKHNPSIVVEACLPRRCTAMVTVPITQKKKMLFYCWVRYLVTAAVYRVTA
jgi:hypothetical protein